MCDFFFFCVPSLGKANPAENGTWRWSAAPLGSPSAWTFSDDFVWIQPTERHISKQRAEQWLFSSGGMKAWSYVWDLWSGTYQIPNAGEGESVFSHHRCLIYLSHWITSSSPGKPNTLDIPGHLRSVTGAGINHQTRHLLRPAFRQHTSWQRLGVLASIHHARLQSQNRRHGPNIQLLGETAVKTSVGID